MLIAASSGEESSQQTLVADDKDSSQDTPHRSVHDIKNSWNERELPRKLARAEGDEKVKDKAVNEVYDNVGTVLEFYKKHFKWHSIDNKNMDIVSTVHFGEKYENACECHLPFTRPRHL